MDFSKLSQNEKLATYGSIAVIVGGLVGLGAAGLGLLAVVAAIGMLAVVFLPQMSPSTRLPGSKGSLMLALGAIAAVVLVLGFLTVLGSLGILLQFAFIGTVFYLIAVAGGVLMAWAGWQEFQAEGGKFQVGTAAPGPTGGPTSTADEAVSPARTADAGETPAGAPAAPRADADRVERNDEDRPTV
ncbi:MAG: hypothetical protein ACRDGB_14760 [Candidatus Limnocylindria bacterium]